MCLRFRRVISDQARFQCATNYGRASARNFAARWFHPLQYLLLQLVGLWVQVLHLCCAGQPAASDFPWSSCSIRHGASFYRPLAAPKLFSLLKPGFLESDVDVDQRQGLAIEEQL